MTDKHPIFPPPELVREWVRSCSPYDPPCDHIALKAARWGADTELEACCKWVESEIGHGREWGAELRAVRRSKLPSLKELALKQLQAMEQEGALDCNINHIRAALEAIPSEEE